MARGATPETVSLCVLVPTVMVASCRLPAAVEAVWLPWPLSSRASVPTIDQAPISLSLQIALCWGWLGAQTPTYLPAPYGLVCR